MRIREIAEDGETDNTDTNTADADLITTLEFLRNRAHNKKLTPVISTQSLINMVKNIGGNEFFNYENLLSAQEQNPAVGEIVKNIDQDKVTLNGFGDETDADAVDQQEADKEHTGPTPDPQKVVGSMAKKALSKRS